MFSITEGPSDSDEETNTEEEWMMQALVASKPQI
jgi:hypothetical protein